MNLIHRGREARTTQGVPTGRPQEARETVPRRRSRAVRWGQPRPTSGGMRKPSEPFRDGRDAGSRAVLRAGVAALLFFPFSETKPRSGKLCQIHRDEELVVFRCSCRWRSRLCAPHAGHSFPRSGALSSLVSSFSPALSFLVDAARLFSLLLLGF
ncbi:hypothetical protein M758_2G142600 [Ceratodon purpureus]|nr:hypothetical protein M758_2G142600 [Ceratodon purpureus]